MIFNGRDCLPCANKIRISFTFAGRFSALNSNYSSWPCLCAMMRRGTRLKCVLEVCSSVDWCWWKSLYNFSGDSVLCLFWRNKQQTNHMVFWDDIDSAAKYQHTQNVSRRRFIAWSTNFDNNTYVTDPFFPPIFQPEPLNVRASSLNFDVECRKDGKHSHAITFDRMFIYSFPMKWHEPRPTHFHIKDLILHRSTCNRSNIFIIRSLQANPFCVK